MVNRATKFCRSLIQFHQCHQFSSVHSNYLLQTFEENVKAAILAKNYQQIPDLLNFWKAPGKYPNPFSFLSTFPKNIRTQIIDEILQSLIPLRPRFRAQTAHACLLSYTLQSPGPLPLALAILQRTLRAGCVPVPQTHLLLSSAWMDCRRQSQTIPDILLEMQSIGYQPDCGTCNYLISSLCAVDKYTEAVKVVKGMATAGCTPDLESYGSVISAMCTARRTTDAVEMLKQMVTKVGLTPRQGTLIKVVAALRANREIWKAVDTIEFLEQECVSIGFEPYELVIEGCLECRKFLLAGKMVMCMTGRGFIPYIKVRQKVVEGLVGINEWKLACAVRQRFAELRS